MKFGEMLREAMGDLKQVDLAKQTGIPQATISRYILGQREPGLTQLDALERALPKLQELRAARPASVA